ncbi:MAG: hypothetical protein CMJ17_13845 [Phenylobacterium sp.]|nr:hypothetical protein [Phenylobacterium sp.]
MILLIRLRKDCLSLKIRHQKKFLNLQLLLRRRIRRHLRRRQRRLSSQLQQVLLHPTLNRSLLKILLQNFLILALSFSSYFITQTVFEKLTL